MPIKFGSTGISNIKFGNNQISKVYHGNDLVWQHYVPTTINLTKINNFTEVSNSFGDGLDDNFGNPTRKYWRQWAHFQNVILTSSGDSAMISIDAGQTWATVPSFTTEAQKLPDFGSSGRSICYGNGIWINVGDGGRCIRSTDGVNWTKQDGLNDASSPLSSNNYFNKVIHNGTYFLAVGRGVVAKSTDGITWEARRLPGSSAGNVDLTIFYDVAWNGQRFVAAGSGDAFQTNKAISFYSSDGLTWTESNLHTLYPDSKTECQSISWNGSIFVILGKTNTLAKSTDGITWSSTGFGPGQSFSLSSSLANNNDYFIATQYDNNLFRISQTGDWPWYNAYNDVPYSRRDTVYYNGSEFMFFGTDINYVPELWISTNSADVDTFE